MKSLCVYCGSSSGITPNYADAARKLAQALVERKIALVYGGGNVGLMGIIADEAMRLGGHVTGVIPKALVRKEVGHRQISELHIVENMHERKAMMADLAEGFIAMPGGIGTLEELFEVMTWAQLGFHDKPIGVLNVDGYYDALLAFLQHTVQQGFLRPQHEGLLMVEPDVTALLHRFETFEAEPHDKFLNMVREQG
ncbi:MAG: TIGR00730 family Rossman fold protein [Burkholderiaceae bacterium]|nr:TIGR00730 family Rossman fold protein [Burkholderiaceae bacterium]